MAKTKKTEQKELKNLLSGKRISALDYETSFFAFIIYNLINRSEEDFISLDFFKLNLSPNCRHFEDEKSEKFWLNLGVNYNPENVFSKLEQLLELKSFDKTDQERLANYLIKKCPAKFMLIIKNTDFILNLYDKQGFYINSFDKKYMVSFKNRNNRDCEHLIVTNYELPSVQNKITAIPYQKQLQYA